MKKVVKFLSQNSPRSKNRGTLVCFFAIEMNAEDLFVKLDFLGPSGHTLNLEERAALQSSLLILKKNAKFRRVQFWGKVFGANRDYLLAQGTGENLLDRKSFCRFVLQPT